MLQSDQCDVAIRSLAQFISERGFCLLPSQTSLTITDHKLLVRKLGSLTTRPATSDLWIHPVNHTVLPDGTIDGEIMTPKRESSVGAGGVPLGMNKESSQSSLGDWHTDGAFETVPTDYTALHIQNAPISGGDTIFASAYAAYDLLSPTMALMLESLTATFKRYIRPGDKV